MISFIVFSVRWSEQFIYTPLYVYWIYFGTVLNTDNNEERGNISFQKFAALAQTQISYHNMIQSNSMYINFFSPVI